MNFQLHCWSGCHIFSRVGETHDNIRFLWGALWGAFRISASHHRCLPQMHSVMYAHKVPEGSDLLLCHYRVVALGIEALSGSTFGRDGGKCSLRVGTSFP